MKVVISEKQLANLIGKHKELGEASTTDSSSSSSASSSATSATAAGAGGSTAGQSAGPEGKGQMDFAPYPADVSPSKDKVQRSVGNPVDSKKERFRDYPNENPALGPANPKKGM